MLWFNVCVLLNLYVEILTPEVMVLGSGNLERCLGHEDGALINRNSALIKEAPESQLAPLPCEGTVRSQQSMTQKRVLTRTSACWYPDLGLSASRNVSNKFLLLISHPICGIFVIAFEDAKLFFKIVVKCTTHPGS